MPTTRTPTSLGAGARSVLSRAPLALLGLLSLAVAAIALTYLRLDPSTYFEPQRATYLAHQGALLTHVCGAVLAILTMPVQLSGRIRRRRPRIHRLTGRVYVVGVVVGGAGGLALSTVALGGAVARVGFACLAVAWLATTAIALLAIRRRDIATHRRWMLRSAALTSAAITLRLYLGLVGAVAGAAPTSEAFATAYAAIAWLSWVPNLALAWWWTSRQARVPDRAASPDSPVAVGRS